MAYGLEEIFIANINDFLNLQIPINHLYKHLIQFFPSIKQFIRFSKNILSFEVNTRFAFNSQMIFDINFRFGVWIELFIIKQTFLLLTDDRNQSIFRSKFGQKFMKSILISHLESEICYHFSVELVIKSIDYENKFSTKIDWKTNS